MFEHLNTPEEIFSFKLGSASQVADLLRQNLEQENHALEVARSSMKMIAEQGIAVGAAAQ
jgi:hypothetical protein